MKGYIYLMRLRIYSEMYWRNYQCAKELNIMSTDQPCKKYQLNVVKKLHPAGKGYRCKQRLDQEEKRTRRSD
jgi:hypothetical protein